MVSVPLYSDIIEHLRDICARYAVDELASCRVDSLAHEETVSRIRGILPGAKSIIVVLKRIPDEMIGCAHDKQYQEAASRTYDDLCSVCEEIVLYLERQRIPAVWPGRQKTPHQKHIAVKAGLGSIGGSKLLISSRHGVDVHLESVIVGEDIPIPQNDNIRFECSACGLCVDACPVGAIGPEGVDRDRCVTYRQTEVVPHNGRNYCGLCMKFCPQREHPTTESNVTSD